MEDSGQARPPQQVTSMVELSPQQMQIVERFFAALAACFIARKPALHDAVKHFDHFLFGRLPRNL